MNLSTALPGIDAITGWRWLEIIWVYNVNLSVESNKLDWLVETNFFTSANLNVLSYFIMFLSFEYIYFKQVPYKEKCLSQTAK